MSIQPKSPTNKGPAEMFTGEVWMDPLVQAHDDWPVIISAVHFTPGAHSAWHSHEGGQTLYVTEGRGFVQSRDTEAIELRAGDTHFTADGQVHWHGAAPEHLMTHLSITRGTTNWGDHVTDEHYGRATS